MLQLSVACLLFFGLAIFDLGWGWRALAAFASLILTHHIWEAYSARTRDYLGPMLIADDDPIMLRAMETGTATVGRLLELFPRNRSSSMVRFRFVTDAGNTEHVWGNLIEVEGKNVVVELCSHPMEHSADLKDPRMTVAISQIDDWQIEFPDGTIRGGFTNLALFQIFERDRGFLPSGVRKRAALFRGIDD